MALHDVLSQQRSVIAALPITDLAQHPACHDDQAREMLLPLSVLRGLSHYVLVERVPSEQVNLRVAPLLPVREAARFVKILKFMEES